MKLFIIIFSFISLYFRHQTWGQTYYDYHGECDLVLLDAPSFAHGLGLTAHTRNKGRYGYSFIESAAIKIGDDILEKLLLHRDLLGRSICWGESPLQLSN